MSTLPVYAAFSNWLANSFPGERKVYWHGLLSADRGTVVQGADGAITVFSRDPADLLGRMAWKAYQEGKVNLVQRKLAPGRYDYIAERR